MNGTSSEVFDNLNGTCQGCALSLLLLVILIEHLACAIHQNASIQGVRTPSDHHKLSLYAEDLLIYAQQPHTTLPSLFYEFRHGTSGTGLPDCDLYYKATLMAGALEWFPLPFQKASVMVEQDLAPVDLRALLWGYKSSFSSLSSASPLTTVVLTLWYRKGLCEVLSSDPSPLSSLFDNLALPQGIGLPYIGFIPLLLLAPGPYFHPPRTWDPDHP